MDGAKPTLAMVVAAAGLGLRLDSGLPKQYVPLLGIPMIERTLTCLSTCDAVDDILLVVNPPDVEYCQEEIRLEHIQKVLEVTAGAEKRPLSVRNGLRQLAGRGTWDLVGVHDGARPLVTCEEISRAVGVLADDPSLDGAVLATPSSDTVKIVDDEGIITSTPDRRALWRAQTPQIFRWKVLMEAYDASDELLLAATDDSALVEARGGRVAVVEGSPENFKVTNRVDLRTAEQILAERRR